jgi:hypothetical protein
MPRVLAACVHRCVHGAFARTDNGYPARRAALGKVLGPVEQPGVVELAAVDEDVGVGVARHLE